MKSAGDIRYYIQRLLPFLTVYLLYDAIEVACFFWGGHATAAEKSAQWTSWFSFLGEIGVSFCFTILPYLLYLIALPAPFHGGKSDRRVTRLYFSLFCLLCGVEEISEILSGNSFHLMTATFLQDPGAGLAYLMGMDGVVGWLIVLLGGAGATVLLFRNKMMADRRLGVPSGVYRVLFTLGVIALAFLVKCALHGIAPADNRPEIYQDGMFSLFDDLMVYTAVPNLAHVFAPPCLWAVTAIAALYLLHSIIGRFVSPALAPGRLLRCVYTRMTARYGNYETLLAGMLLLALAVRLFSLGVYPLMDTTEARYGEMARKMLETGNWLQPQFDYGVPFWGKPPLSFWCSALSMKLFGVNEFAARFAPFAACCCMGALFFAWPFAEKAKTQATACFVILLTTAIGFVAAGAVMTDAYLALGAALAMTAFYRAVNGGSRKWGYLFFAGLAVGLMGKGPIVLVLCGLPLFLWVCLNRRWRDMWRAIPWVGGGVLLLGLTVPWYVAAECETPGFLRYFLVGEHIERFVVKGWQGDLYGAGHSRAIGTIWLYGVEMLLPWVLLLPFIAFHHLGKKGGACGDTTPRGELSYLWLWLLSPMVFFTFARNVLPAYVLPGLPAFCLLLVNRTHAYGQVTGRTDGRRFIFFTTPLLMLMIMFGIGNGFSYIKYRCHKELLASWDGRSALYYYSHAAVPYSAQFYSNGRAVNAPCPPAECPPATYAVVHKKYIDIGDFRSWTPVASDSEWVVYTKPATPAADGSGNNCPGE